MVPLIGHNCREKYGDYFGIGVAGYPEAHPDVIVDDADKMKANYWADIEYLKKKVCLQSANVGGTMLSLCAYTGGGRRAVCRYTAVL